MSTASRHGWCRAKGKKFPQFSPILKQVLRSLKGQRAIWDGEIVVLDEKGRSNNFPDFMARCDEPRYYAFDLVWLNRQDLRSKPLLERKQRLRRLIPPNDSHLLYVDHLEGDGARFFELACEQDLEGIICKPGTSRYPFTWIKVTQRWRGQPSSLHYGVQAETELKMQAKLLPLCASSDYEGDGTG